MKESADSWNDILLKLPNPHILQTEQWSLVKAQTGWAPIKQVWFRDDKFPEAAALVLQRAIPVAGLAARLRILYVPKGPLLDWQNSQLRDQVLDGLQKLALRQNAIFIKIDPDVALGFGIPGEVGSREDETGHNLVADLNKRGWLCSQDQIQFKNTVIIDLDPSEETLLAQMKQKTRYNIRLAERKGIRVRSGDEKDLPTLYHMYAETSVRDGFVIRDEQYYENTWKNFIRAGLAKPLIAEFEGEQVAALILFLFGNRAWYMYGMSRDAHRDKMPNYLLQWEAIRQAKASGVHWYDLWGAPDEFTEQDSMWGVFRFKEGLGGNVVRHIGAWDYPSQPILYKLYAQILPKLLNIVRRRGQNQTRQALSN